MPNLLYELIKSSSEGDQNATMEIIEKFFPLIKKYSIKLSYEDADTDLIISLIEIITYLSKSEDSNIINKEECIVGYISESLKHKYIQLSKVRDNIYKHEVELNIELSNEEVINNEEENIFLNDILNKLPELQRKVIKERYLEDRTCSEIAKKLGISRQAVNKLKNRALNNLRKYIEG